jgi:hypothetical protein
MCSENTVDFQQNMVLSSVMSALGFICIPWEYLNKNNEERSQFLERKKAKQAIVHLSFLL